MANQAVDDEVAPDADVAVHDNVFNHMIENLHQHEDVGCEHYRNSQWAWCNQGSLQCEACNNILPDYIFMCKNCWMRACNRCWRHRLRWSKGGSEIKWGTWVLAATRPIFGCSSFWSPTIFNVFNDIFINIMCLHFFILCHWRGFMIASKQHKFFPWTQPASPPFWNDDIHNKLFHLLQSRLQIGDSPREGNALSARRTECRSGAFSLETR